MGSKLGGEEICGKGVGEINWSNHDCKSSLAKKRKDKRKKKKENKRSETRKKSKAKQ